MIYTLVAMRLQRVVIGLGKSRHCQTCFASRGIKTYSEGRLELRNLQLLKKMQEKSSQFLSSDQPSEPKSLDVALNIAGVEKCARKTCDCGQPGGHAICVLNGKER